MRKGNHHKKVTQKDWFASHYFCQHTRLAIIRCERKTNKRKFRRYLKELEEEEKEDIGVYL